MIIRTTQILAFLLTISFCFSLDTSSKDATHADSSFQRCPDNQDELYDRRTLLEQFDRILKTSIPAYAQFPSYGFFVYDLNDPVNKYIPVRYAKANPCIRFINNHSYHFSPVEFAISQSHVAVLEDGKPKIFKSINCKNSKDQLNDVIAYAEKRLKNDPNMREILTRLKNYRRYGFYSTIDSSRVETCNADEDIPRNPDKQYDRSAVLKQLSGILQNSVSESVKEYYSPFFVEGSRANGFFLYDVTEPSNKQTSLLERVDFKDGHVYHVAYIDLPFSFSHIIILEHGKLKVFKAINCDGGTDTLNNVVQYLRQELKNDKDKEAVIQRVRNYRNYGVYSSFAGLTRPRCSEVRSN